MTTGREVPPALAPPAAVWRAMVAEWARFADRERFRLRPTGPGPILDVGCGSDKFPGAVGLDRSPDTAADVVADLDEFPYPLDDDSFGQILCQDVIEHVTDPLRTLTELHRIARPGGRIHIRTPHYSSVLAYSDATHRHYLSAYGLRLLAEPLFGHYPGPPLRVVDISLQFWPVWRLLGVSALANLRPLLYETYFAFRFPAMNIRAEFEVLKP